jgi:hypothetical protein
MMNTVSRQGIRSVALPAQHGGWGFWLEPFLAGLLIAASWAGFWLGIAALFAFLLHQPLKTTLKDRLKGKWYDRTRLATTVAAVYGGAALLALLLTMVNTTTQAFWLPLMLALPLAGVQIWHELHSQGREAVAEIAGALAFSALAPALCLLGGVDAALAGWVWLALALRAVVSILYVRSRLRLEKGKAAQTGLPLVTHGASILLLLVGVMLRGLPWTALVGGLLLLARAAWGLSFLRHPVPAKVIGFSEIAYGLIYVVLLALGIQSLSA